MKSSVLTLDRNCSYLAILARLWIGDAFTLIVMTAYLIFFRLIFQIIFNSQISNQVGMTDSAAVIWQGSLFDLSTAACCVLVLVALSSLHRSGFYKGQISPFKIAITYLFFWITTLVAVIDLGYFYSYGDHLNQLIFGVYYGGADALLATIWKEYHPIALLVISCLLAGLAIVAFTFWLGLSTRFVDEVGVERMEPRSHLLICIILVMLFVTALTGGQWFGRSLSLQEANVTDDWLLNRLVINPLYALWHTVNERLEIEDSENFSRYWPDENIDEVLSRAFPSQDLSTNPTITGRTQQTIKITAAGSRIEQPQHIFLILLESHSGWVLYPEYRRYQFSPELASLGDEGIYIKNFLPSSDGTIGAVSTFFTGLPDSDLYLNHEASLKAPLKTSGAYQFRRLGYKTRLFYGGSLPWQNIGKFAQTQGFEQFFGQGDMSTSRQGNEWGIDDEFLYGFVESQIQKNKPSFNFILTTSNHPPYDLDLTSQGFIRKELPKAIAAMRPSNALKQLGHLWYADKQLGKFVRRLAGKYPNALFAITGDHTARLRMRFSGNNNLEPYSVPLVLFGNSALSSIDTAEMAGSHIDIMPTLLELSAPRGFEYYSFGQNLLRSARPMYGIGKQQIVSAHSLMHVNDPSRLYPISPSNSESVKGFAGIMLQHKAQRALSWYSIKVNQELLATSQMQQNQP